MIWFQTDDGFDGEGRIVSTRPQCASGQVCCGRAAFSLNGPVCGRRKVYGVNGRIVNDDADADADTEFGSRFHFIIIIIINAIFTYLIII